MKDSNQMDKIIDGHSHFMPPEVARHTTFYKNNWSDIDRQLAIMDEYHVEKALLLYPTSDAHIQMEGWANLCEVYNQCVADVVAQYKGRFIGAAILPMDRPELFEKELKRIEMLGLNVISLASSYTGRYLDDEMFFPIFEFAQDKEIPIHVHPQIIGPIGENRVQDPLLTPVLEYMFDVSMCVGKMMMEGTFDEFPDVKFIFAHYGGVLPLVAERFDNTYQMLRNRQYVKDLGCMPSEYFRKIYFDTSGSKSITSLLCCLDMADASHVIFGSDFPANQNIGRSISLIESLSISQNSKKMILRSPILVDV